MKTFKVIFGVFALAITIGLFVSCVKEESNHYYDELREAVTQGQLVITGLENYNGKIITATRAGLGDTVTGNGDYFVAFGQVSHGYLRGELVNGAVKITNAKITDGQVTLKVYNVIISRTIPTFYGNYNGNDKNVLFNVYIYITDDDYGPTAEGTITVDFTDGIGSGQFVLN